MADDIHPWPAPEDLDPEPPASDALDVPEPADGTPTLDLNGMPVSVTTDQMRQVNAILGLGERVTELHARPASEGRGFELYAAGYATDDDGNLLIDPDHPDTLQRWAITIPIRMSA